MNGAILTKALVVLFILSCVLLGVALCDAQRQEAETEFGLGIQEIDSKFPDYCQAREHFENARLIVDEWSFWPSGLIVKRKPDYPFYIAVAAAMSSQKVSTQPCSVPGDTSTIYADFQLITLAIEAHEKAKEWGRHWREDTQFDVLPGLYKVLCQKRKDAFRVFVKVIQIKAEEDCFPAPESPPTATPNPNLGPIPSATPVANTAVTPIQRVSVTPRYNKTAEQKTQTPTVQTLTPNTPGAEEPTLLPAPYIKIVRGEISFSQCRKTVVAWGWIRHLQGNERFSLRVERDHPTPQVEPRAGGNYPEPQAAGSREFRITDEGINGTFWIYGYISLDDRPISHKSNRILLVCGN
ncbi:hypothetical protein FBQ82_01365 [Anaerolineae bacterium CFX7]|nr:hypothetical protein [Anaerolineae bacterium CFX7]